MLKTISFGTVHFGVVFARTGSRVIGGLVALLEPLVNSVVEHCHERAWASFPGRSRGPQRAVCAPGG